MASDTLKHEDNYFFEFEKNKLAFEEAQRARLEEVEELQQAEELEEAERFKDEELEEAERLKDEELKRKHLALREKANLILEYDDMVREAYNDLINEGQRFADAFLERLAEQDDISIDELKSQVLKDCLPFDDDDLNVAYLQFRELGDEAQEEFVRAVNVVGDRVDVSAIAKQIHDKFKPSNVRRVDVWEELRKLYGYAVSYNLKGLIVVHNSEGEEIGQFTKKELQDFLLSKKMKGRQERWKSVLEREFLNSLD